MRAAVTLRRGDWLGLVGWLALVAAVSAFGSMFRPGSWYEALAKPSFNPPSWVFGPVWTLLYLLMALAAWLVWRRREMAVARLGMALFLAQLLCNGLWSWFFFGLQRIGLALVDLVLLVLLLTATVAVFARVRKAAAWLLAPYLAWSCYALVLNAWLWRFN